MTSEVVALLITAAVVGGGGYLIYNLYEKHQQTVNNSQDTWQSVNADTINTFIDHNAPLASRPPALQSPSVGFTAAQNDWGIAQRKKMLANKGDYSQAELDKAGFDHFTKNVGNYTDGKPLYFNEVVGHFVSTPLGSERNDVMEKIYEKAILKGKPAKLHGFGTASHGPVKIPKK